MLYRSLKNANVGLELASLLDAQESIPWFLEFVFAVHGKGKIYNCGAGRQIFNIPFRRKDKNPVTEKIYFQTSDILDTMEMLWQETNLYHRLAVTVNVVNFPESFHCRGQSFCFGPRGLAN